MPTTSVSIGADNVRKAIYQSGKTLKTVNAKFSITAAASAIGDQYVLTGPLSVDDRVARIVGATPALTSATDNDLGFFTKDDDGVLVELDKDVLWDGVSLATALSYRDLLTHLNAALDTSKSIGELIGRTRENAPVNGIFLVLTTNVANTAAGPVILDVDTIVEQGFGIL